MTFPKNRKPINLDKLSEVLNDNETHLRVGKEFYQNSDVVISEKKETPVRITQFSSYVEDEWDNIHGDIISFR